jgi:hypothetical protein
VVRGRSGGGHARSRLFGVETHGDRIPVELAVIHASEPGTERERWQVMACKRGRVVDIRAFESHEEAVARATA